MTLFEGELVDVILWLVKGFKTGQVTRRAACRILRASLRRFGCRLIARSDAVTDGTADEDHAIPMAVATERLLSADRLDRREFERIASEWFVKVRLTKAEHQLLLPMRL